MIRVLSDMCVLIVNVTLVLSSYINVIEQITFLPPLSFFFNLKSVKFPSQLSESPKRLPNYHFTNFFLLLKVRRVWVTTSSSYISGKWSYLMTSTSVKHHVR